MIPILLHRAGVIHAPAAGSGVTYPDGQVAAHPYKLVNWINSQPTLNLARSARNWESRPSGDKYRWRATDVNGGVSGSESSLTNGIPNTFLGADTSARVIYGWTSEHHFDWWFSKPMVLKWDGDYTFDVTGSNIGSKVTSTGRVEFQITGHGNWELNLTAIGSSPPTNFYLGLQDVGGGTQYETLHDGGTHWLPDWTDLLKNGTGTERVPALRVMQWMSPNTWDEFYEADAASRITTSDFAWPRPPIEALVQLANDITADLWLTYNWRSNTDLITSDCTYAKANLNGGLKFMVEAGNEAWNYGYPKAWLAGSAINDGWNSPATVSDTWSLADGARVITSDSGTGDLLTTAGAFSNWHYCFNGDPDITFTPDKGDSTETALHFDGGPYIGPAISGATLKVGENYSNDYHLKRSTTFAKAAAAVFTGSDRARLVCVLAGGRRQTSYNRTLLRTSGGTNYWFTADPANAEDAATNHDAFTVATYFGSGLQSVANVNSLVEKKKGAGGHEAALKDILIGSPSDGSGNTIYGMLVDLESQRAEAAAAGLPFIAYEGGQHFFDSAQYPVSVTGTWASDGTTATVTGTGGAATTDLVVGSTVHFQDSGGNALFSGTRYEVSSIGSDNSVTLSAIPPSAQSGMTMRKDDSDTLDAVARDFHHSTHANDVYDLWHRACKSILDGPNMQFTWDWGSDGQQWGLYPELDHGTGDPAYGDGTDRRVSVITTANAASRFWDDSDRWGTVAPQVAMSLGPFSFAQGEIVSEDLTRGFTQVCTSYSGSGTFPTGLSINASGQLTGTVDAAATVQTYTPTAHGERSGFSDATQSFNIDITAASYPTVTEVTFDGTADYLTASALTGQADTQNISMYLRCRVDSGVTNRYVLSSGTAKVRVRVDPSGLMVFQVRNSSNTVIGQSKSSAINDGLEHEYFWSFNGATGATQLYVDGASDNTGPTEVAGTVDFDDGGWEFGALSGGSLYDGGVWRFCVWPDVTLDVSQASVRTDMADRTAASSLGTNIIDLYGPASDWNSNAANNGTGGTFTMVGSVT